MADDAVLTIVYSDGGVFVDVACPTDDLTLPVALGMLELAKDVLIRGEGE
jgi:hypothetical protein